MRLPRLPYALGTSVLSQASFSSLNETPACRDGGIKDMADISGEDYPFLSARGARTEFIPENEGYRILGAGFEGQFFTVVHKQGTSYFYYGGKLKGKWSDEKAQKKQFAVINRYICIFPDAVYYRTEDAKGIEEYKATHDCETEYECRILCSYATSENDGGSMEYEAYGSEVLSKWQSTSLTDEEGHTLYRSTAFKEFYDYAQSPPIGKVINKYFFEGDSVNLCYYDEKSDKILESRYGIDQNRPLKIKRVKSKQDGTEYSYFETDVILLSKDKHEVSYSFNRIRLAVPAEYYERFGFLSPVLEVSEISEVSDTDVRLFIKTPEAFVFGENESIAISIEDEISLGIGNGSVISISPTVYGSADSLRVEKAEFYSSIAPRLCFPKEYFPGIGNTNEDIQVRIRNKLPETDFVCASNNRIFAVSGKTLYAGAFGDPFTWFRYEGTDADCYAVEIAGSGDFTALFPFGGVINIFRSDRVIKLYGDVPSEFQTYEVICDGVKAGCSDSVCVISGSCYYVSERGVELYGGSMPSLISDRIKPNFGDMCAAASDGRRYYLSGAKESLYVFDTENGGWYKEKKRDFYGGFRAGTSAYAVSECGITLLSGKDAVFDGMSQGICEFPFYSLGETECGGVIEFGDFYLDTFGKKRVHRLILRIFASKGCAVRIYIGYDGKPYERAAELYADEGKEARLIPIIPKRCDRYRLKIEADRYFRLEGLAAEVSSGGI